MKKIQYITGDVTSPKINGPTILAHVVNTEGGWGAGVVVAISKRWKKPEEQYRLWHKLKKPDNHMGFKLGEIQMVTVEPNLTVCNMLAQEGYRSFQNPTPLKYGALRECLEKLASYANLEGASVVMPKIGSGLGGGNWNTIEMIIQETLTQQGISVTVYSLP